MMKNIAVCLTLILYLCIHAYLDISKADLYFLKIVACEIGLHKLFI